MPNRNEAALAEILREVGVPTNNEEAIAAYLAQRGVLVPGALTDESASLAFEDAVNTEEGELVPCHSPAKLRAALERIAKGEP